MMANTWFIICATGKSLVHLRQVNTQQAPATAVTRCCHLHLCFKQGTAIGRSLGLKGFTQLLTQRRCQWRRHRIANLAMLVVDIAPELEVVWESLHHTALCFITDTGGMQLTLQAHTHTYAAVRKALEDCSQGFIVTLPWYLCASLDIDKKCASSGHQTSTNIKLQTHINNCCIHSMCCNRSH